MEAARSRHSTSFPAKRAIARNSVFSVRRISHFLHTDVLQVARAGSTEERLAHSELRQQFDARHHDSAEATIGRSTDRTTPRTAPSYSPSEASRITWISAESRAKDTDFNFILYGVNDRGQLVDGVRRPPASGYLDQLRRPFGSEERLAGARRRELSEFFHVSAVVHRLVLRSDLFGGTHGGASFEALGYLTRSDLVAWRVENFLSTNENDKVSLRRLPSVEFRSRDRQVSERVLPVWVSLDSSASFLRRNELGNPNVAIRRPFRFRASRDDRPSMEGHPPDSFVLDSGDALWKQSGQRAPHHRGRSAAEFARVLDGVDPALSCSCVRRENASMSSSHERTTGT